MKTPKQTMFKDLSAEICNVFCWFGWRWLFYIYLWGNGKIRSKSKICIAMESHFYGRTRIVFVVDGRGCLVLVTGHYSWAPSGGIASPTIPGYFVPTALKANTAMFRESPIGIVLESPSGNTWRQTSFVDFDEQKSNTKTLQKKSKEAGCKREGLGDQIFQKSWHCQNWVDPLAPPPNI